MDFKRSIIFILLFITIIGMSSCTTEKDIETNINDEKKMTVAVSIVPQETFVKAVSGDLVNVITMIPPGNSPANYQPTPKQMAELSESKAYFSIGVPTEEANILSKIEDFNQEIKVVSLVDKVGEVYPHRYFDKEEDQHDDEKLSDEETHHNSKLRDPHIWLSLNRVKVMIEAIKNELAVLDPNNQQIYEKNAAEYITKIEEVDKEIRTALSEFKGEAFIIFHPAFGYFADDYGLKMVTIEGQGKKATPMKVQKVIDFARKENIKFVFYQEEFDSQQAETIANEIGGSTVKVAPLSPNYIENLRYTTETFKEILK